MPLTRESSRVYYAVGICPKWSGLPVLLVPLRFARIGTTQGVFSASEAEAFLAVNHLEAKQERSDMIDRRPGSCALCM